MRGFLRLDGTVAGSRRAIAGLSLLVILLTAATVAPWRVVATASAPVTVRVVHASVGDLQAAVNLNGELRAADQIDITSRVTSRITRLPATVGRVVEAGEVLAELDRGQLEVAVAQAQAALAKERAALAKLGTGSRAEEIAQGEASIRAAEAKLVQLDQGARPEEVAKEEAAMRAAEVKLAQLDQGPWPEEVAKEAAAVRAAEAKLVQLRQGPRPEDVDMAVQELTQAQNNRARMASQLGSAKEQARVALEQATASLQAAQAQYGAAKLVYDEAVRTGKDPNIAPSTARDAAVRRQEEARRELTDIKLRTYKADFEAREAALRAAEAAVEAREIAYEDAKQQEIAGVQIAAAQILEAQANLDKERSGPDADIVAKAEADLESARASLAEATRGPDADVVAKAEADLESARASLAEATRGPDADVVAKAQADLETARAGLAKAQGSGLDAEVQAAQANVQSAEAALRLAEASLREGVIVAPFAGIITQKLVSVGSVVTNSTPIVQLVSQEIEVRLSADDTQVTLIEPGQRAEVRLSGYPGIVFPGRVLSISPTASTTSRTFTVTLALDATDARLKPGMLVQADVAAINRPGILTIPDSAVVARATENYVFVVADGKARRRTVTLGVRGGGNVEVLGGVTEGDQVIVEGQTTLNDGDQVTIKN